MIDRWRERTKGVVLVSAAGLAEAGGAPGPQEPQHPHAPLRCCWGLVLSVMRAVLMAAGEGRVEAETSKRLGGAAPDVTAISDTCGRGNRGGPLTVQECPAHKKPPPPRTLQWAYAWGPMVFLEG